jgi:subtilisin family serine protease
MHVLAGAAAFFLVAPIPPASPVGLDSDSAPYIVMFRPGAADPDAVTGAVRFRYRYALSGYAADLGPAAVGRLRRDPRVASVTPDRPMKVSGVPAPDGIARVRATSSPTAAIDGRRPPVFDVNVAVIDTGIDNHPDLNLVGGKNCSTGYGYRDRYGHGTHAAGTIGAFDDGRGVVGVAPGVRLWAVRVLDDNGGGELSEMLCGIDWVTSTRTDSDPDNDIDVANVSVGGPGSDDGNCGASNSDPLHVAICRSVNAGVTYVVAAGNASVDAAGFVPASFDEVISVSAMTDTDGSPGGLGSRPACRPDERDDNFASFSNFGRDVDFIAPGVCVVSTLPRSSSGSAPAYGQLTGTSFAAPHVSGAAALYLARHSLAGPEEVRQALLAAGSRDWDDSIDPDGIKEPRIDVADF